MIFFCRNPKASSFQQKPGKGHPSFAKSDNCVCPHGMKRLVVIPFLECVPHYAHCGIRCFGNDKGTACPGIQFYKAAPPPNMRRYIIESLGGSGQEPPNDLRASARRATASCQSPGCWQPEIAFLARRRVLLGFRYGSCAVRGSGVWGLQSFGLKLKFKVSDFGCNVV